MDRIKTCPHCGGTACINRNYSYKLRAFFVMVKCDICGATGKTYIEDDDTGADGGEWETTACNNAVKAWNMRTDESSRDKFPEI